jgi:hypothetical protein
MERCVKRVSGVYEMKMGYLLLLSDYQIERSFGVDGSIYPAWTLGMLAAIRKGYRRAKVRHICLYSFTGSLSNVVYRWRLAPVTRLAEQLRASVLCLGTKDTLEKDLSIPDSFV